MAWWGWIGIWFFIWLIQAGIIEDLVIKDYKKKEECFDKDNVKGACFLFSFFLLLIETAIIYGVFLK